MWWSPQNKQHHELKDISGHVWDKFVYPVATKAKVNTRLVHSLFHEHWLEIMMERQNCYVFYNYFSLVRWLLFFIFFRQKQDWLFILLSPQAIFKASEAIKEKSNSNKFNSNKSNSRNPIANTIATLKARPYLYDQLNSFLRKQNLVNG